MCAFRTPTSTRPGMTPAARSIQGQACTVMCDGISHVRYPAPPLQPKLDPLAQPRRQLRLHDSPYFVPVITGAEVRADNQLVLEPVRTLDEVVQVHVTELVDLLPPMVRPDEA